MKFETKSDVIVEFDGVEHRGEVLSHRGGYVMAMIATDASTDYGQISPMMSPRQTVCVPERKVRLVDLHSDLPN